MVGDCTFPNQKPWITVNIRTELQVRAAAFKERDANPAAYKKSRYALRRTIKQAKCQYRTKINRTTPAPMLVGCGRGCKLLQTTKGCTAKSDTSLPDKLNYSYSRFETSNTETSDNCVKTFSAVDVSKTFIKVNIHKAAGPDGLPGHVLQACTDQLARVVTDSFYLSLSESVITTCFKQTT